MKSEPINLPNLIERTDDMSGKPIKVLLVEDNPGDALLLRETLADTNAAIEPSLAIVTLPADAPACAELSIWAVVSCIGWASTRRPGAGVSPLLLSPFPRSRSAWKNCINATS